MAKPTQAITTRVEWLPLAELELLDLNARFMRHEQFAQLVENVKRDGDGDRYWLALTGQADEALDALTVAGDAHGVVNQAAALQLILDVFARHVGELQEGFVPEERSVKRVPLAAIVGTDRVPQDLGRQLVKALERAKSTGSVPADKPWKLLEQLVEPAAERTRSERKRPAAPANGPAAIEPGADGGAAAPEEATAGEGARRGRRAQRS